MNGVTATRMIAEEVSNKSPFFFPSGSSESPTHSERRRREFEGLVLHVLHFFGWAASLARAVLEPKVYREFQKHLSIERLVLHVLF